jgi:proline dehydrogenase
MRLLNKLVVEAVPLVPRRVIRYFAGRYIAGETLEHAIQCVRQLNTEGVCATMDVLGEDITTRAEAVAAREQSVRVLHAIAKEHLDSNLSIKLTSLGLKINKDFCTENVREILKAAASYGTFVRIDMEAPPIRTKSSGRCIGSSPTAGSWCRHTSSVPKWMS